MNTRATDLGAWEASFAAGRARFLATGPELARVEAALDAARERFAELERKHLAIALLGGTGVGKSTLLNAIAGREISRPGDRRPTTSLAVAYHHGADAVPEWLAPEDRAAGSHEHDLAALRGVLLIDLPDIDSYRQEHRALVHRVVAHVDLLLVVTSPEKYADQALFDEIRALPQAPRNVGYVLNAVDRLADGAERDRVVADFRAKLAAHAGTRDGSVLPVSARAAFVAATSTNAAGQNDAGGLAPLLAFIERLGTSGERRQVLAANADAALAHLERAWHEYLPAPVIGDVLGRLAEIPTTLPDLDPRIAGALVAHLVESTGPELRAEALRRSWFPIGWLDFLRRGAARLFRRRDAGEASRGTPPSTGDPASSFTEGALVLPLRRVRHEMDSALAPLAGKVMVPARPTDDPRQIARVIGAGLGSWQADLTRRGRRLAWKMRQHVIPVVALLAVCAWFVAPLFLVGDDPAGGTEETPAWRALLQRLFSIAAAMSPTTWLIVLAGLVAYYVLMYSYFLFRIERNVEREAERAAALYQRLWRETFDNLWGAAARAWIADFRHWWNAMEAASGR